MSTTALKAKKDREAKAETKPTEPEATDELTKPEGEADKPKRSRKAKQAVTA